MSEEQFDMAGEYTGSSMFEDQPDGGAIITIKVPMRFRTLWLVKLSDLRATMSEINLYADET